MQLSEVLPITVTILTKDAAQYLDEVLAALKDFDEVLILDNGSTDTTLEIAKRYPNVTIRTHEFIGFGPLHNLAIDWARHDWILSIDADEIVSPELLAELRALNPDPDVVYEAPRRNLYKGQWIRGCGWWPDKQRRLFNRKKTRFTDAQVHETVATDGMRVQALEGHIVHMSYASVHDFLRKMQQYSELFAEQNRGRKRSSMAKAIVHGLFTFFKSYILKMGFRDGAAGFEISIYNANTAFYKYLKLAE